MKIHDAEQEIATILAGVEREYEADVDGIEIQDIEVTRMEDNRPQLQRHVRIEMKRRPGQDWAQAREAR